MERFSALKMLANISLLEYDFEAAKEFINQLLDINATYAPNKNDESLQFISMVDAMKNSKMFSQFDALVTTATKQAQLASDAPATIHVVSSDQILTRGYTTLIELLEDIPSVEIQRNSMNEFKNIAGFRGISGNEKFIIMVDGIRITPASGDPYALATNYSLVNAGRVEVILGPASALYGVDAFSGIINIISKNGNDLQGTNISSSVGQYSTVENSFISGFNKNGIDFSISGHHYKTAEADYYNLYPEEYRWYNDRYLPNAEMPLGNKIVKIQSSYADDRSFQMPSSSYFIASKVFFGDFEAGTTLHHERHSSAISKSPAINIYTEDAFLSTNTQTAYLRHNFIPQLNRRNQNWSLKSMISFSNYTMDPKSKFIDQGTLYQPGYEYQYSKSQKIEEQFEYTFSNDLSMIAGASYESISALPLTSNSSASVITSEPTANQEIYYAGSDITSSDGEPLGFPVRFYNLNYSNFGSFLQFQYKPGSILEFTFGGRYDYNTRYSGNFNPRLGILIRPSDKIKVKVLYGQAILAPSPWKAFASWGVFKPQVDPISGDTIGLRSDLLHLPNVDLKPEKLNSLEGSLTWLPNKHSRLSIGGYYNYIQNLISLQEITDVNTTYEGIPVALIERTQNQGNSVAAGISLQASISLIKTDRIDLSGYGSYTFSDGFVEIFDRTNTVYLKKDLPLNAKHTFKSGLDVKYNRFSGSLRFIYRSKSTSVKALYDIDSLRETQEAYGIFNLNVLYKIWDNPQFKWSAFVKVNNLLDARYYNVSGSVGGFNATPQDPRRINIGVNLAF
jgi:iron complex outermembrane receptor protein